MKPTIPYFVVALIAASASAQAQTPTAAEVADFIARAEQALSEDSVKRNRVDWVNQTYLTDDTNAMAADAGATTTQLAMRLGLEAAKYRDVPGLSDDDKRKLNMLSGGIVLPAPDGAELELSEISTRLQSRYGMGQGTLSGKPINGSDIEAEMATNRNPAQLQEMWVSWHDNVGTPMRADYSRLVEIANSGAHELGFPNVGAMWRSQYDMPADDFMPLTDKLWSDVKPLYDDLHCYTRTKLNEKYGDAVQPKTGPIRADLLGNMWAQGWGGIYDIVAPEGAGDIGYDLTDLLKSHNYDPKKMVETGEAFFSSLGFPELPNSFWTRSLLTEPADREVVCHASAWDIDNKDDLRVKMCIKVNDQDFVTIQHELGHNYYQRAYNQRPYLHLNGANDGFHEAIGDTIALSITPDYLVKIGLLNADKVPSAEKDIGLLLRQAMDKVAFLPFGLLIDKWRWGVFDGSITPANYNAAWDKLRLDYQGVVPPVPRTEANFDPGAKFHIPATTPYTRYFLSHLLQFQFYQAACAAAGWTGPLHRCSFYGNKDVGQRLNAMLEMGTSKPWPDALEVFTGTREMSGEAIVAYFAPVQAWLKEQNKGKSCGW